ncbi:hypothetical protein BDW60DRAFT_20759 [Aspergillus nidulans var. acristatus]
MHTTFTYGRPIAFIFLSFLSLFFSPFLSTYHFLRFLQFTVTKGRLTDIFPVMFHTGATLLCFPMLCLIRVQNDLRLLQPHYTQLHCKQLAARFTSLIKQAQAQPGMLGNKIPRCYFYPSCRAIRNIAQTYRVLGLESLFSIVLVRFDPPLRIDRIPW